MNPPLETDKDLLQAQNVFKDIIAGDLESSLVYRDGHVIAIMDIQPVNPGHVLVMPIEPVCFLSELPKDTASHLFVVAQKISMAIRHSNLMCTGVNMLLADGASAGQEIPHVHLHIFPRFESDEFGFTFAQRYFDLLPSRAELDDVAAKIRQALVDVA